MDMNMNQIMEMFQAMGGLAINLISTLVAGLLSSVILTYAVRWFIFRKAGEKGWKALIPFYSDYIHYKICWDGRIYLAILVATVANTIIGTVFGWIVPALGAVVSVIGSVAVAAAKAIADLIMQFKFARAFGRSDYFVVGLYFLNNIFTAIIAFGDSEYKGPQVNDGIGVPRFIDKAGQRASAAATAAASAAAQQLQNHVAHQQQQQQMQQQPAAQPQYPQQPMQQSYAPSASYGQQPQQPQYQPPRAPQAPQGDMGMQQGYAQMQGYSQLPQQGYDAYGQQPAPRSRRTRQG